MISIDMEDLKKASTQLVDELQKDIKKSKHEFQDRSLSFRKLMVDFLKEKKGFIHEGKKAVQIRVKKGNIQRGRAYVFEVEKSKNLYPYTEARRSKKGRSHKHNFGLHYVQRKLKSQKVYEFRVKSRGNKFDWLWSRDKKRFVPDTTSPSHVFIKNMKDFEKQVGKKLEEFIDKAFYS